MPYSPVTIDTFGGLDLRDPLDVGLAGAVDVLNVIPQPDVIQPRFGTSTFATLPSLDTARFLTQLTHDTAGNKLLVVGDAKAYAYKDDGTVDASQALTGTGNAVEFGTPTSTVAYIADNAAGIRKYDPSSGTFTLPVTAVKPYYLAVMPWDNRLVAANTADSEHRVNFSDAGDAETITQNVDLTPGDGEYIGGVIAWNNLVFVFKQSRFFVFYSTTTDASGNPIFNYRPVAAGIGLGFTPPSSDASLAQACAGRSGVYFWGADGIYLTAGDVPVKVSGALDPFFQHRTIPYCPGLNGLWTGDLTNASIAASNGYVYCSLGLGFSPRTFVMNETTRQWSVYFYNGGGVRAGATYSPVPASSTTGAVTSLYLGLGSSDIVEYDDSFFDDSGASYTWNYQTGTSDLGSPDRKVIRESALVGFGSATLQAGIDGAAVDTGSALTLGTYPQQVQVPQRIARRGRYFNFKLSGTMTSPHPTRVTRLIHRMRDAEEPK